jgi:hypothetical protein
MLSSPASFSDSENIESSEVQKPEIIIRDDPILQEIAERLRTLDPDSLSPRDALEALYAMRNALENTEQSKHLED